jgi:hypothetical protein
MHPDPSRPVATSADDCSLTINEALLRYEHAGHARTPRSIQRYCEKGHLECLRQQTPFGERYMITPASVARHIAQTAELAETTRRDRTRQDAAGTAPMFGRDTMQPVATSGDSADTVARAPLAENTISPQTIPPSTSPDVPRPVATSPDLAAKYIDRLEGEIAFLREEIGTKNVQIKELSERSHETNHLIGGLQRMLSPLLGARDPFPPTRDSNTL